MTPPEQISTTNPVQLPPKLSNTRCLRLNKADDDALVELCKTLKEKGWDVDIVTAIRESVKIGLPHYKERWAPLLNPPANETATATTAPGAN